MRRVKRWLTYKLVTIASQLDGELFMRLCEVAVMAKYLDQMEIERLEQEHYYDNQEENYNDADSNDDTTYDSVH
jgi:hypothetical protein